jgi:sigma-B regulation protein RsbU (phosphoserine phosphatase)
MGPSNRHSILVCAADATAAGAISSVLESAGHPVRVHLLSEGDRPDQTPISLVIVDGGRDPAYALDFCRRLRLGPGDAFAPLLFILDDPAPSSRLASLEAGADTYILRPFAPGELLAQVQGFLRIKQLHARLTGQTAEMRAINQRLKQAYQQIDLELEAARRLQLSFLPQALPEVGGARFAVCYRPCGRVGGDFYDVFRLDEDHVGLYVADAMGHGVPASLLTIFLKRAVRGKEISGKKYRLLKPAEVLQQLNRELLDQKLPEIPFITMIYVLLNCRDGTLQFARAGHPHPLHVPHEGDVQSWPAEGGLLGVFVTEFRNQDRRLQTGDKLLLYTDGLDTGASDAVGETIGQLQANAAQHQHLPIEEYVPRVAQEVLSQVRQADDFTLLGVEMRK